MGSRRSESFGRNEGRSESFGRDDGRFGGRQEREAPVMRPGAKPVQRNPAAAGFWGGACAITNTNHTNYGSVIVEL